ncbi:MAG: LamG-like jellyroll fold domain-containing protein, partial [Candidatus Omnitrophota bacterium]
MKTSRYNLFQRLISVTLIFVHLFCFGPVREALAYSAQSASYKLKSGTPTLNGEARPSPYTKLLLHNDGVDGAISFTDAAGNHSITNNGTPDTNTKLLLHCNGPAGAANFTDDTGKTVTTVGNSQIDTAESKFGTAGALFDGNGDYLTLPDSDDWNFGTGDFTIDFWVKFNVLQSGQFFTEYTDGSNYMRWFWNSDTNALQCVKAGGTEFNFSWPWSPSANTWYHLAFVKNGNNYTAFVNGTQVGTTQTSSATIPDYTEVVSIGAFYYGTGITTYLNGWLDEFRVSKGIARWTSNFTPPVSEYALNNQVINSSAQSKFGSSSAYFNNSYLSIPDNVDFNFGNSDFTIDFWFRINAVAGGGLQTFINQYETPTGNSEYFQFYMGSNGDATVHTLYFLAATGGSVFINISGTMPDFITGTWHHAAIVRNGNNFNLYFNGVSIANGTSSSSMPNSTGLLTIGAASYQLSYGDFVNGWMDEFRISKGIARWTSNFTPPAQPYIIDDSDRPTVVKKTWLDALGEAAIGKCQSQSYVLNSGFIPTVTSSDPPIQIQTIPNFSWQEGTTNPNAFDLDDYFLNPVGFTYTISGNVNVAVGIDPITHLVSFSQNASWFGTEKIKFTATDSEYNSSTTNEVTLQVSGVNNPPVLAYIPDIGAQETDLVKITPNATDLDGDTITYSFTAPLNAQGEWQTDYSSAGTPTVIVTATDSTGLTDTQEVHINVMNKNRLPVLLPINDITKNEGDLVTITPQASDPDLDAIIFYYSAPFDSTGKWLTDYYDAGNYPVIVTASDGTDTVWQNVNVIINNTNRAPQATLTLSKYTATVDEVITITLNATDPDTDPLTFSLKKDGVEFDTGTLSGAYYTTTASFSSVGDHNISATVTDSGGLSASDSKGIDIPDPNASSVNPVMGDFNGDALLDLGLYNSQNGNWEIALSDKGVFRNAVDWLPGFGAGTNFQPLSGDFNADNKTDIAVYDPLSGQLQAAYSTGSGFSSQATILSVSFASVSWQAFSGNFNADKYPDFALYNKDTGEVKVALGNSSGFGTFNTWIPNFGTDYIALSADFNADSLSDLCLFKKSSGEFKVAFSNTLGFIDGASWRSGFANDKDPILSDFNHDGLADIGYWDKASFNWYYAISAGDKFIDKGVWANFGTSADDNGTTGDFNGDGVNDLAVYDREQIGINRWRVSLSTDKPADLLTEIDNGIGGKTQVVYTYAATADNPALPFPVYVASSISLIDAVPSTLSPEIYTQNFIFSGGYYDSTEREFRGFEKVKVSDPITNNYTETYFYQGKSGQDGALKGQIEKLIAYDGSTVLTTGGIGRKISETFNTYEVKKAGPASNVLGFPALIENTTTIYEENGSSITTRNTFTYDNIGNVLEEVTQGDIAKTGDEKSTQTLYNPAYDIGTSTTLSVGFNRPQQITLKDASGTLVSQKNFVQYDSNGNLLREEVWLYDPLTSIVSYPSSSYSYDSFGNLTSSTNSLGKTTTTDYETTFYAYPEKVTNSLSQSVTSVYDAKFGVVIKTTDPNGLVSEVAYDSLGRPTQKVVHNPDPLTLITYSYPDFNTKITTNAIGLSATEYIDGLGRKYKTVSVGEDGNSSRQVSSETYYNNRGLTDKETLPHYIDEDLAQISYIRYEYDLRGRIKKTISDFPGTLKDAEGSVNYISPLYIETTDPEGHRKGTLKDVYGNIIEVTEFTSSGVYKTSYQYDNQNNLLKTIDAQGNTTEIFYDSLGRKLKMLDPDMGTWLYEYDLLGNLKKQIDAKGQALEFTYDVLNRLTKKEQLNPYPLTLATYQYDEVGKANCIGRLSKITDQSGSSEFFYDRLGRETKSIKTVSSVTYQVSREYDVLDRLTKLTYPDGEAVDYSYDTNSGLLEKVFSPNPVPSTPTPYVNDISYNSKGQIKTIQYGNATQTDYTYGQDLRLSQILTRHEAQGTTLQNLNYVFDKNGNITTLTDNLRSNIRTYIYDDLDRLTTAQNVPAVGGGYTTFNYQYDSIGNMTYKSDVGVMTYGSTSLTTGGFIQPHALTSAGGYSYQYDANGNMTVGKNKTMQYDAENRLVKVDTYAVAGGLRVGEETYLYDGDGGRVRKTKDDGGGTISSTTYIGSLYEVDSNGIIRKHIFAGANRVCTIMKDEAGGTTDASYYHSDHLGSSNVITDSSGNQVEQYEYSPYGAVASSIVSRPSSLVRHKFTGKELDSTGLYFYGARY